MTNKAAEKVAIYVSLALLMFFTLFPFYMLFSNSLKNTPEDLYALPPRFIPESPTLDNYIEVLTFRVAATFGNIVIPGIFLRYFFNSLIVAIFSSVLCTILASLSGYSFSRFGFYGSRPLLSLVPISQMFPVLTIGISLLPLFVRVNLMNTHLGLIIGITGFALPFSIWQAKAFFDKIPVDLDHAALTDGCTDLGALLRVVFPVARPGIIAILIFAFLVSWDEYIWVLLVSSGDFTRTIPIGIVVTFWGEEAAAYHVAMAAAIIFSLPVLLLFIFFQRYLVSGLIAGAVKG